MFLFNLIIPIMCVYGAFALVFIINVILGVINNCIVYEQEFEFKRILVSLIKILSAAIVTGAITVGFNLLVYGASLYDIKISETVISTINIGLFLALYASGFVECCQDVYNKVKDMFGINVQPLDIDVSEVNEQIKEKLQFNEDFEPDVIAQAQAELEESESVG